MEKALRKNDLIIFLSNNPTVTTKELLDFYREFKPDLPINTLRWRIYELKRQGIIYSPKRGVYTLNKKDTFQPIPTPKMDELAKLLQEKFPYIRFSMYLTKWLGSLTKHMFLTNNLVIEVDADVLDATFHFLKEHYPNTFLSPEQKMYDYYISSKEENIIINRLHVDAPLNKIRENYYTPKLEKLIIDLVINDPVIFPVGAAEIETMITNALDTYNINYSTLIRYANKRHTKQKLGKLIPLEGGI